MSEKFIPAYLKLFESGELKARVRQARDHLADCDLCANRCHVNRQQDVRAAACHTGDRALVYSSGPHHGEERPLSGRRGSGTIFFSWCNLRCVFCQNWDISQRGEGREVTTRNLAQLMLNLQGTGCHNINLVSASHVVAQILAAVDLAASEGLRLPLVYNSGGYDNPEALALLDGVIDIYMPDMKFADSTVARKYIGVKDYAEVNRAAVKEMHRQVGDLAQESTGLARRGLLIRHLVLPENLAGTDHILAFIAHELSPGTYLNLMDQYRPCYRAAEYPPLDLRPGRTEFRAALRQAEELGFTRLVPG